MNNHHKILLLFFNLFSFSLTAQELQNPSYKKISDLYMGYPENDSRAMVFVNRYIEKAKKEHSLKEQITGYEEAIYYIESVNKKLSYADSVISVASKTNEPKVISRAYLGKGIIYYYNSREYKNALELYLKAYKFFQNSEDDYLKNKIIYHLGIVKNYLGYYQEASEHFKSTSKYFEKQLKQKLHPNIRLNNEAGYFNSIYGLSNCYKNLGLYEKEDSLINIGLQKIQNLNEHLLEYGYFQKGKGVQLLRKGRQDEALKHLELSRDILLNNQDYGSLTTVYFYLGKLYWLKGNKTESLHYLNKVDSLVSKFRLMSPEIRSNYQYLISDAKQNGDSKRYSYFVHRLLKADSDQNDELPMMLSKINQEYDNDGLSRENQLLENKNQNLSYLFLLIPVGLILSIYLLSFWRRVKERKITEKYNEILKKFNERNSILKTEPIADNKTEHKKEPYSLEIIEDIKVKLKKFEEDKLFLAKNLTLPKVAKMLGRNHSQLSYVLNEHLDITFTHYLKTLRIRYITNLLVENKLYLQYKVENLAHECGMSSRQLFSTHFFEINGIRPIEFIREKIKENKEK